MSGDLDAVHLHEGRKPSSDTAIEPAESHTSYQWERKDIPLPNQSNPYTSKSGGLSSEPGHFAHIDTLSLPFGSYKFLPGHLLYGGAFVLPVQCGRKYAGRLRPGCPAKRTDRGDAPGPSEMTDARSKLPPNLRQSCTSVFSGLVAVECNRQPGPAIHR